MKKFFAVILLATLIVGTFAKSIPVILGEFNKFIRTFWFNFLRVIQVFELLLKNKVIKSNLAKK